MFWLKLGAGVNMRNRYLPQQSPINLITDSSVRVQFPPDYLEPNYMRTPLSGYFCGHNDFYLNSPLGVGFDAKRGVLESIELYSPSEHLLNGVSFDFEFHFLHTLYSCVPETGIQRTLILGVFFKEDEAAQTPTTLREWNEILKGSGIPKLALQDEASIWVAASVTLGDILPSDLGRFFRYEGSLTTPFKDGTPNNEVASWLVFPEVIPVHPSDVAELKQYASHTVRQPQPIHRRFVLRTFD